jgi:23S rRNA maturation-related 3'-5' exoribonuclease YhaM
MSTSDASNIIERLKSNTFSQVDLAATVPDEPAAGPGNPAVSDPGNGMDKSALNSYIFMISDNDTREFTQLMLEAAPDYFWEVAASSTGKYHPEFTLGEGGLVRHTKAALNVAISMFDNPMFAPKGLDRDEVLAAILVHDTMKLGWNHSKYTRHEHPVLVRELYDQKVAGHASISQEAADRILDMVASHMGPWNTDSRSDIVLPKPATYNQKLVHLCDYIASRKYMTMTPPK